MNITSKLATKIRNAVYQANERAKKRGAEGVLTYQQWARMLSDSEGQCHYCKMYFGIENLTLEHIKSLADGGSNLPDNLVPACGICNQRNHWGDQPLHLKPIEKTDELLTVAETARYCGCTTWLVTKWRKLGKIEPRGVWNLSGRHILYHRDDIHRLKDYVDKIKDNA